MKTNMTTKQMKRAARRYAKLAKSILTRAGNESVLSGGFFATNDGIKYLRADSLRMKTLRSIYS